MKKFLAIVGGIFLILVVLVAGFLAYAVYQGIALDASSKAYVDENVSPIISTWSKQELVKRASPQLLKTIHEKPEQIDQLFQKLSKLGALQSCEGAVGDSNISYTTSEGKVITASYFVNAKFENGDARVAVRLVQVSARWQFLFFSVNSPLFLD